MALSNTNTGKSFQLKFLIWNSPILENQWRKVTQLQALKSLIQRDKIKDIHEFFQQTSVIWFICTWYMSSMFDPSLLQAYKYINQSSVRSVKYLYRAVWFDLSKPQHVLAITCSHLSIVHPHAIIANKKNFHFHLDI